MVGAVAGMALVSSFCLAQAHELSARAVFLRLPVTIFENTGPGFSEDEKYELLDTGATKNWLIRTSTPDTLELHSADGEFRVSLCLFRSERGTVAVMGTDVGPVCVTELWRMDSRRGASPMSPPFDPDILDFFDADEFIPPDVKVAMTYCVRPEGLAVRPIFWTPVGMSDVQPDNAVFYLWAGGRFSKRVVPLRKHVFTPE
jgi:hypothetical protein